MFTLKLNTQLVAGVLSLIAIPLMGNAKQPAERFYSSAEKIRTYLSNHYCNLAKTQDGSVIYTRSLDISNIASAVGTGENSDGDGSNPDATQRGYVTLYGPPTEEEAPALNFFERGDEPEFVIRFLVNESGDASAYVYPDSYFIRSLVEIHGNNTNGTLNGAFIVNRGNYSLKCTLK